MVDGTNEVAEQQEEFDYESIVLRRADPDDFDEIINLVEIGEDDIYNRVYSFPNVLKLIETAYLAITVIDREGRVVAFAAFEDHPQVSSRLRSGRSARAGLLSSVSGTLSRARLWLASGLSLNWCLFLGDARDDRRQTLQLLGGLVQEGLRD
jgi:hypothetical protein